MATDHSTDRDAFGHWLSGFTDGEGCFYLGWRMNKRWQRMYPHSLFQMALRSDDRPVLEEIHSFWNAGRICHIRRRSPSSSRNAKPRSSLIVSSLDELKSIVIPHFDAYMLRAKKARDYQIWKQGIELQWRVFCRKTEPLQYGGARPKWTSSELSEFASLSTELRQIRQFEAKVPIEPEIASTQEQQQMTFLP